MDGYERIIRMIKNQNNSSSNIFLTIMESSNSCYINSLKLENDDLLISDRLVSNLKKGDSVIVVKLNDTKYAILERVV